MNKIVFYIVILPVLRVFVDNCFCSLVFCCLTQMVSLLKCTRVDPEMSMK